VSAIPYVFDPSAEAPMHIVGDLVGWEEKLTSGREPYDLNKAFSNGSLWLDEKVMPDRLVIDKRRKWKPDGFRSQDSILVASSQAREIIESFDPGVHQFFPLEVTWRNGEPIGGEWFSFNAYARQDSIVIEQSTLRQCGGPAKKNFPAIPITYRKKDVALIEARLGSLNLWRELNVDHSLLNSDALHDAFRAEGLRFFWSYETKPA